MTQFQGPIALTGRILLALMFVISGFNKINAYSDTQQYMEAFGAVSYTHLTLPTTPYV